MLVGVGASALIVTAQRRDAFDLSIDHPAIGYRARPTTDSIARLTEAIERGEARLTFHADHGYLRSLLDVLRVPVESQVVVFSGGSKQASLISAQNPRAIFFNDRVAVGWVRGADELEIAATDPEQGAIFYALSQKNTARPAIQRNGDGECLQCHITWETRGVPGLVVMSTLNEPAPDDKYSYATGSVADHRSPFIDRWGGWYVTGRVGTIRHLGNDTGLPGRKAPKPGPTLQLDSLAAQYDQRGFLSAHSDVVALMVLEHQATMTNLLTWTGWEARVAAQDVVGPKPPAGRPARQDRLADAVSETVDYMLFVDEALLTSPVNGSSTFTAVFEATGARDSRGRSLRQFDLRGRLFRFPCSYLIESEVFDRLPATAKAAVYARLWRVLSGEERGARYERLTRDDRQAIVEILREIKSDLPDVFRSPLTR